jgi:[acyl-carrier-protein] S-malonyltransferase
MQQAVPVGEGAMAAILGANYETVAEACRDAQQGEVCSPANINSAKQVVIAGQTSAVERAIGLLKERGAKRAIKLNVSAPFHCALMLPAQEQLAADLESLEFRDLGMPLVSNVDAALVRRGADARDALVRQVSSPVRWLESLELLARHSVTTFVEVGPGKVLCGLVKGTISDARCLNVEDPDTLSAARAALLS